MNPAIIFALRLLCLLYALALPLHYKSSIKILIPLLVLCIVFIVKERIPFKVNRYLFSLLYFLIVFIGIFYSEQFSSAFNGVIEKIALIPAFYLIGTVVVRHVKLRHILLTFLAGTIIACLICLSYAIYRDQTEGAYWAYYHMDLTDLINSHPIYMAYFVNFSMVITVNYFFLHADGKSVISWSKVNGSLLILFLVLIHVLLSGRAPIFALVICSAFYFFILTPIRLSHVFFLASLIAILGVAALFLKERTILLSRFNDLFVPQTQTTDTQYGGYVERMLLWKAGINSNENVLFGVGTGDTQTALNNYYLNHNYGGDFVTENYNAHNQFIQTYLAQGLIGLTILLLVLGEPIINSIKEKNLIQFMFYSPFIIYGITEVFLGRYQGVAFYFFFSSFFYFSRSNDAANNHS